ncbi:MAG: hypothetical protein Q8O01_06755, partial [Candidatus Omnitrophota bacterium]|nr:hypothetical protein [Candidatus Omnitrophota bacterium]
MASLAVILGYGVRQKATVINRLDVRDRLRSITDAGVKTAICELKTEQEKSYDCMKDSWSNNKKIFGGIIADGGSCDICYKYVNEESGISETRYGLIDEERKININKLNREVIQRLLQVTANMYETESQALAAS